MLFRSASRHAEENEQEREKLRTSMIEKASRFFSTDEEYEEFGYERAKKDEAADEVSETEDLEGDVELF